MDAICLNLIEATVTLYPANADGTPQMTSPLWTGCVAETLRVQERWLKKQTMPTGARYPVNHPLISQYEISIGRVWVVLETQLAGWQTDYRNYVLDITWVEEETQEWHRQTYYGVTFNERSWDARDVEHGSIENQVFDAQYMVPAGGAPAQTPPPISNTLPYRVLYTDATGSVLLYTYDADTGQFTAVADTTGRATISYPGGALAMQFAGDASPVLKTSSAASLAYRSAMVYRNGNSYRQCGLIIRGSSSAGYRSPTAYRNAGTYRSRGGKAGGILSGFPTGKIPRLDFMYGADRVFTLTPDGLYDVEFVEAQPTVATGQYRFFGPGNSLIATASPGQLVATQIQVA